ncbi:MULTISPECIES: TerC family protein [Brevibacillus]|uniref:Membrane protein n=1 Tax=Brevibacillus parabrevis TaxID=54914 RepID=A0A4Y3PSR6_BREPA|nr:MULTISPECIES: TerC family protein [Brevibacillus]MDH6352186.1 YjbE family integral membrane protein [Brevibacillus sp. 1238]MDR4998946.1 TerC family protein [Brevibacillus parabrevis]MED2254489.1 TerC family protein [Brevibacillus parabrevis]NRQ56106.1 TerC family protein [Brevibacillus sp. HD1.4A]RNB94712.1 TerC family protein [Brevibacillus parabrevis]
MVDPDFFSSLLLIITINIVLSGDNAVVIAIACRRLPAEQQKKAIVWGTTLAVIVRVIATILAVYLLKIPYLYLIGGTILLWISYNLLREGDDQDDIDASEDLVSAVKTIVVADIMMGLDNVLAIAGAAQGNILLIVIGLLISVPLMVFGSQLILRVMERFAWLVYFGSGVLALAAANMILTEETVRAWVDPYPGLAFLVKAVLVLAVLLLGYRQRSKGKAS